MLRLLPTAVGLSFCLVTTGALAQARVYEKTVARGKTVAIMAHSQTQTARGCTPNPAGAIDQSPKPKLGTVITRTIVRKRNGPCGVQEYPTQIIAYQAGAAPGVDEFILHVHSGAFFGGSAFQYKVKINVR